MAGPIRISIIGDNAGLNASVDESSSKLGKLGGVAGKVGRGIAVGLAGGAVAVGALAKAAVSSASDAQQSLGATQTIFGKYADTVIKRSNEAAQAIGLSANEYRELSNVVGASLKGAGLPIEKVTGLTDKLNTRAADLAATFGGTTAEAVESIGSLLRGEADPIEKYGISIKESDVQARLAAKGLDGLTGQAAKQASMQERLNLLMEKSSDVSGAFGRESGTLANQQQKLGASWENLKAKGGAVLLPILTKTFGFLNSTALPAIERLGPPALELAQSLGAKLAPAFSAVGGFLRDAAPPAIALAGTIGSQLGPALAFVGDLIAGAAPILQAYGQYVLQVGQSIATNLIPPLLSAANYLGTTFGPIIRQVSQIIVGTVVPGFKALGGYVAGTVIPIVARTATTVGKNLKPVFDQIANTLQTQVLPAVQKGIGKFREWWPTIQKVTTAVLKVTGTVVGFAAKVLGVVLPPVIKFAGFLTGTLFGAVGTVIGILVRIAGVIVDVGTKFVQGVRKVQQWVTGVKNKVGEAIEFVKGIPGKITGALSGAATMLKDEGIAIVQGLLNGIIEKAGSIVSTITSYVIDKIPGPVRKALGIASPSRVFKVIGGQIIDGLVAGVIAGASKVEPAMSKIAGLVESAFKKITGEKIKPARLRKLMGRFDDELKRLRGVAERYKTVTTKLTNARNKLAELQDYAAAARDGAIGYAKVTAAGVFDEEGRTTSDSIVSGLTNKLAAIKDFAAKVAVLRDRGVNKDTLDQIISEGVEGGLATAQALVAGGSAAAKQVNDLQAQINTAASQLGTTGASAMYAGGITAAQELVAGLASRQAEIVKQAERIGKAVAKAIRRELGSALLVQPGTDEKRNGNGAGKRAGLAVNAERAQLSTEAKQRAGAAAGGGVTTIRLKLTADQVDQLRRGKETQLDLDAYHSAGGRPKA